VPDASSASITVRVRQHRFVTLAATSEVAAEADRLQHALEQGPCVLTAGSEEWVRSDAVARDERWPEWGVRAAELGIGSVLSVSLLPPGEALGALTLYADGTDRFGRPGTLDHALVFAVHAAHALASARTLGGLEDAMSSQHTIGVALGIVMERLGLDLDQARELLTRAASAHHVEVSDMARQIVDTRTLPRLDQR